MDFVGPVCESADFLGKSRRLPCASEVVEGDLFAVLDAGAYGMAMASNYNLRARPAEVMVDGDEVRVVRPRETYEEVAGRRALEEEEGASILFCPMANRNGR